MGFAVSKPVRKRKSCAYLRVKVRTKVQTCRVEFGRFGEGRKSSLFDVEKAKECLT